MIIMAPNDLANLMTVGGAALCWCTQISILWGLWKCDRNVSNDDTDDEEAPRADANANANATADADANADANENQNP